MIEIDLLPAELRERKKKLPLGKVFKKRTLIAILAGLVVFQLFLQALIAVTNNRINKLQQTWQGLSSQKAQIDQLKAGLAGTSAKVPLIEQLISNRLLWSKQLNKISDLLTAGIWLNELSINKETAKPSVKARESLIIQGSAASLKRDEPALIGRFMQNLKDDSSFSAHFSEIELGPIKKRQIGQTEVMDFTLICRFKDGI